MENSTPAEKMYSNHLKIVSNYQKRNPEKMRLKYQKRIIKLKENPEEYRLFREKAKISCQNHRIRSKLESSKN